jgi:hypothetical protein
LEPQIQKRGVQRLDVEPDFVQVGQDTIIGSARWLDADGKPRERYQVIRFREGKIVDLQGCRSRREAGRVARRR